MRIGTIGSKIVVFLFVFTCICCCSGTAKMVSPSRIPLGPGDITTIHRPQPVAIINAQPSAVSELSYKGYAYRTDLRDWADDAVQLIKRWLQNNDVPLVDSAEKKLKVSILSAEILPPGRLDRTYVQVMVETGDGVKKVFPAQASANGYDRSAGYAIYYSVRGLIKEGTLSHYISEYPLNAPKSPKK